MPVEIVPQPGALRGAAAVRQYAPGAALYVCGGGAHNQTLLGGIYRYA